MSAWADRTERTERSESMSVARETLTRRELPGTAPSNEELATKAQVGCGASFEELLRRFQVPLLSFLRHVGPAADAEDVLQETFMRAYSRLHFYRSQWKFATWLFTIARRTLSEDEVAALWLHYVDEMPVGEIAAVLDRSTVAVKTMMFRARKKLLPLVGELAPCGR